MEPWSEFLIKYSRVLDRRSPQDIRNAWSTRPKRTDFYADHLLPAVAKELQLEHSKEFLSIDHVLRDSRSVPRVFIESENIAAEAHDEIRKLCAVSCPLRVLLTVVEWDLTQGVWTPPYASQQDVLLRKWGGIAVAHQQSWPNRGLLALLVGELCDPVYYCRPTCQEFQSYRLRFYAHHFVGETGTWLADGMYQRDLDGSKPDQIGLRLDGWPC